MDLIKLTETEEKIADVRITLKEIADKFEVRHKNLLRDFDNMINSLSDKEIARLRFEPSEYKDKSGKKNRTYNMNIKTAVWFVSKFNHSMRLRIVDYAFDKLEEDYKLQQEKVKELEYKLSLKPKTIAVNTSKINRKERSKELNELRRLG